MADESLSKATRSLPDQFDPLKTRERVSEMDAVLDHAQRVHDWPLLDKAVEAKIEELCAFVDWWKTYVLPNRIRKPKDFENPVRSFQSVEEAEAKTKITQQQVHRWNRKRRDPEKWANETKQAARSRTI